MTPNTPKPFAEAQIDIAEPTAARVAATLPDQLLQGGETVVLLLKPSPWFILLEPAGTFLVIFLAMVATLMVDRLTLLSVSSRDAVLVAAALGVIRMAWQLLEWLSRVYVLTDMRVIRVRGVLRVSIFESPLHNVQHTRLALSLRERLFGLGTIAFATAGTGTDEATWTMVSHPLEAHRIVRQTLQRYR